jgi:hypothetical protein
MRSILFCFAILLMTLRTMPETLAQSAPAHLRYFGYYLVDALVDDKTDNVVKLSYIDEVSYFTNLNQLAIYEYTDSVVDRVNAMNNQSQKPFLSIENAFWYQDGRTTAPSQHNYTLRADYRARWNTFKANNASVLNASKIGCFYLFDEPVWNGVPFSELNSISQMIKSDFPSIPIMYVEAYKSLNEMQIPTTVDWVGFDQYSIFNPSTNAGYRANLSLLKSKRTNGQKIFIVADTHWIPEYQSVFGKTTYDMGPVLQDYYNLAASEPDVIGILGYLWIGGFDGLGVRNMPQSVIDLNIQLGRGVKLNGMTPQDIKPPTVPSGLSASSITKTTLILSWKASTDDLSGVHGYEIFVNGSYFGATTGTSITVTGLSCSKTYTVGVNAFDNVNNISPTSNPISVRTKNGTP